MRQEYLAAVFAYQRQLLEQFHQIEVMNVYGRSRVPLYIDQVPTLDHVEVQLRIKEEFGRIIEEVGEAFDCMSETTKYREEVADAFHFLIELFLILRIDPSAFDSTETKDPLEHAFCLVYAMGEENRSYSDGWMYFISDCTRAANFLKNRPWKKTMRATDYSAFYSQVTYLLYSFVRACAASGITREILFDEYRKKASINQQRILDGV